MTEQPISPVAILLKRRAKRRRAALVAAGCSTYVLGHIHDGPTAGQTGILCLCCGHGSANSEDIDKRYCGFCNEFHSEWTEEPTA